MERDSFLAGIFLVLGVLLIIVAGYSPGQDINPAWVDTLRYYLFVVGVILILVTVALILRKR